ncbi:alpha/beta fold hydrolase [Neorhizobium galegae]|uniref:alpha/beta fold hydrolase n=1 Tax=Neorhizobium galegae TaxID=399 RepID=UPI0006222966|nr:alpha/beta fold hydrolase [Neorhizobium galegae]CDZ28159.1 Putative hydrolase [Neorhizobium galegae bv. officinalis]KAA9386816.1 alpha/beta fold hydrolase [Neorhizobium galegae]KAB1115965.1 alpha/beta fold hydrolase [Neorhizobium galegae]MCM2501799.1 alpha/beta hydrolase [Neorhizobium galegae]MCQ1772570.1 alpha/beta hydrolase [Neorhizobium galegae]
MSIRIIATAIAALAASFVPGGAEAQEPKSAVPQATPAEPSKKGHVEAGGISYYYEIRGEGEPLLLLHGGLGSVDMFAPIMPALTEHRQVIAVDLQGHGRTPLGKRPISLEAMGADMGGIVTALGYRQVDVLGYSMGGGIALQMAAQAPEKVRRLVIASAPFAKRGFFPEMIPQQESVTGAMAEMMNDTPMFISYKAVAPDVSEFPRLLDAMGDLMRRDYDFSDAVAKLTMPVMLVFGDSDMVRPEHIVEFYQKLGGGLQDAGWMRENMPKNRLAILPDLTHYEAFASPALAPTVLPFLDGKSNAPNWAEQVKK